MRNVKMRRWCSARPCLLDVLSVEMPYAPWKAQFLEWDRGKRVISAIFKKKDFRGGKRGAIKKGQSTGIPSSGQ